MILRHQSVLTLSRIYVDAAFFATKWVKQSEKVVGE
jgi:hypothetical protein